MKRIICLLVVLVTITSAIVAFAENVREVLIRDFALVDNKELDEFIEEFDISSVDKLKLE